MTRGASRLRARLRRWVLDWLGRPDTPDSLACEPGCVEHAYCYAVDRAHDGHYVTVLVGVDPPTGQPATYTVFGRPGPVDLQVLTHSNQRIRAGAHACSAVMFHRRAVDAGELL